MCHAIPGRCDTPSGPNDQDHLSIDLLYETASATPPVFAGLVHRRELLVGMCRELHEHREWLWTFVRCEGVEPTNNAGERALGSMTVL